MKAVFSPAESCQLHSLHCLPSWPCFAHVCVCLPHKQWINGTGLFVLVRIAYARVCQCFMGDKWWWWWWGSLSVQLSLSSSACFWLFCRNPAKWLQYFLMCIHGHMCEQPHQYTHKHPWEMSWVHWPCRVYDVKVDSFFYMSAYYQGLFRTPLVTRSILLSYQRLLLDSGHSAAPTPPLTAHWATGCA